jgi:hypothetical protein
MSLQVWFDLVQVGDRVSASVSKVVLLLGGQGPWL